MPSLLRFGGNSRSDNEQLKSRVIGKMKAPPHKGMSDLRVELMKAGIPLTRLHNCYKMGMWELLHLFVRCLSSSQKSCFADSDSPETVQLVTAVHGWAQCPVSLTEPHMLQAASTVDSLSEDVQTRVATAVAGVLVCMQDAQQVKDMVLSERREFLTRFEVAVHTFLEAECKAQFLALVPVFRKYREAKNDSDYLMCHGKTPLIGMTANYAATNKILLQKLQPRVCIVEEAGELLESQLFACLASPKMEHLVLIGDHQQLRPKVSNYTLCTDYKLDISMFERLLQINCTTSALSIQLRMRRSVCDLVRPFYKALDDHPRVLQYPKLRGVATSVFFVRHQVLEDTVYRTSSKQNTHEGSFMVKLAEYFVFMQNYEPSEITILTPYLGQKRLIKELLTASDEKRADGVSLAPAKTEGERRRDGDEAPSEEEAAKKHVLVATVDDYQGEENKIILMSLVRSNVEGKIGFVGIENRVIVALSRAQHGMIIIGNAEMLCQGSPLWKRVCDQMISIRSFDSCLPLVDKRFADKMIKVTNADQITSVLSGNYRTKAAKTPGGDSKSPKGKSPKGKSPRNFK